jgi:hypothetical protein
MKMGGLSKTQLSVLDTLSAPRTVLKRASRRAWSYEWRQTFFNRWRHYQVIEIRPATILGLIKKGLVTVVEKDRRGAPQAVSLSILGRVKLRRVLKIEL